MGCRNCLHTNLMVSTFRCDVCYEQCIHRLPLPKLTTVNGDVIRQADCMHPICRDCVAGFVRARTEEQMVFGVRCPSAGCRNEIQEQDVQALAKCGALTQEISDRFVELSQAGLHSACNVFQLGHSFVSKRLGPHEEAMVKNSSLSAVQCDNGKSKWLR